MNRLQAELRRLYGPRADDPSSHGDRVRALVLELARPASWEPLAKVWQGVQAELGLPAPAIAVSGLDHCQLWFSFSEPVRLAEAQALLASLRTRYLADVAPERIASRLPDAATPPFEAAPGRWSAFVTSDLASLFGDEPWLDLPPGVDAQADLLSRLESIRPEDLPRAMERLRAALEPTGGGDAIATRAATAGGARDPRSFLLEVMNDQAIALQLRIEAAKALLPWSEDRR